MKQYLANQGILNDEFKLLEFIDITRINTEEDGTSWYNFNCHEDGTEKSKNSKKYFRNGMEGTLCHMLSKPNPCEGFLKGWENRKVYEANGCDSAENCKDAKIEDRGLNRRIQLAVYLNDNGIMHYQLAFKCINMYCFDTLIFF